MLKQRIRVENDYSLNKIATGVINEDSIRTELKKISIERIEFVACFSAKAYYLSRKSIQTNKTPLISRYDLEKSDLDSIFEYKIDFEDKTYKLFIINPQEFFHASYIYEMYQSLPSTPP